MEEAWEYSAVMPKNVVLDLGFATLAGLSICRILRMLIRDETLVRDGWRYNWEPANGIRWMYVYGLAIHAGMIALAAFFICADFNGHTR
jgi:hypothetical protein